MQRKMSVWFCGLLAAGLLLKQELERTGRYRVRMTRDSNVYVGLERRVDVVVVADRGAAEGDEQLLHHHLAAGADSPAQALCLGTNLLVIDAH